MPGRKTHGAIGAVTGGFAGFIVARSEPDYVQLIVAASASYGGYLGGLLPDELEPGIHSHHRDVCHSVGAGAGILWGAQRILQPMHSATFTQVAQIRATRESLAPDDPQRFWLACREALCCVVVGLSVGVTAGYVSHLVADSLTPRGLPLLMRSAPRRIVRKRPAPPPTRLPKIWLQQEPVGHAGSHTTSNDIQ